MDVRKSVATLTANERARFVRAVKGLKAEGTYDRYVMIHMRAMMERRPDPAHGGPAFFSWHREYLRRFELDLQRIEPGVTVPFWNWTRDRSNSDVPWTADFMGGFGNSNGRVTTGPFAGADNWSINVKEEDMMGMPSYLLRSPVSEAPPSRLPSARALAGAMKVVPYDTKPWNFRAFRGFRAEIEMDPHGAVHNWVGGNMTMASSPNDPIFWLHHCQVDRLWARWQAMHPGEEHFRPLSGAPRGHNLRDPMWPWAREARPPTAAKVIDYHKMGYAYEGEEGW